MAVLFIAVFVAGLAVGAVQMFAKVNQYVEEEKARRAEIQAKNTSRRLPKPASPLSGEDVKEMEEWFGQ